MTGPPSSERNGETTAPVIAHSVYAALTKVSVFFGSPVVAERAAVNEELVSASVVIIVISSIVATQAGAYEKHYRNREDGESEETGDLSLDCDLSYKK